MSGDTAEPRTTLAIVLGASEWPQSPKLKKSEAFMNSAKAFLDYLKDEDGFNLSGDNLLNLFDAQKSPSDMDQEISSFLTGRQGELAKKGTPPKDLIIYYVGHGGFTSGKQEYFLATRTTCSDREGISSIRVSDLARTVKNDASKLRRFLIFDCCFAASAYQEFQSAGPAETARVKTLAEFPKEGTALLCASSAQDVALAPLGAEYTMFSGALLDVLHEGDARLDGDLTLEQLGDRVRAAIQEKYEDKAVRPEVLSPAQTEGNVANIPLFPNSALRRRRLEGRLANLERAFDEVLRKLSKIDKSVDDLTSARQEKRASEHEDGGPQEKSKRGSTVDQESHHEDGELRKYELPPEVRSSLRLFHEAKWIGVAWVFLSALLCLPEVYSLLVRPYWIFERRPISNPWCWLVLLFAIYTISIFFNLFLGDRFRFAETVGMSNGDEGPWELLPEVVAMRSTKTFQALGSLRIASPLFEIGAALFLMTGILSALVMMLSRPTVSLFGSGLVWL